MERLDRYDTFGNYVGSSQKRDDRFDRYDQDGSYQGTSECREGRLNHLDASGVFLSVSYDRGSHYDDYDLAGNVLGTDRHIKEAIGPRMLNAFDEAAAQRIWCLCNGGSHRLRSIDRKGMALVELLERLRL